MIKASKRLSKKIIFKHSFLRGAMLLWFIVLQLSVFAQILIVKDSIIQTTCDPKTQGAIYLKVSGGTPPYTFKWDNGSDKSFIEKLNGGTYKVEVVDKKGYLFKEHYDIKKAKPIAFNTISYYCDSNRLVYESTGTKYVIQNTVRSYISFDNVMYPIQMTSYYTKDTTNKTTNLEEYFNEKIIPHNYRSDRDFIVQVPLKSHINYNFATCNVLWCCFF